MLTVAGGSVVVWCVDSVVRVASRRCWQWLVAVWWCVDSVVRVASSQCWQWLVAVWWCVVLTA